METSTMKCLLYFQEVSPFFRTEMFLKMNPQINHETLIQITCIFIEWGQFCCCTHIQRDCILDCWCSTEETLYLKYKGVVELRMTSFPPCFGLPVSSVVRRQQLQFDQCGVTLAPNRQVSGSEQRHHQLFSLLLVPQSEPQTNRWAVGKGPFTGFLWELVQVWPYGAQGKTTSKTTEQNERQS